MLRRQCGDGVEHAGFAVAHAGGPGELVVEVVSEEIRVVAPLRGLAGGGEVPDRLEVGMEDVWEGRAGSPEVEGYGLFPVVREGIAGVEHHGVGEAAW